MKKFLSIILAALLVLSTASVALADTIQIGVPNDTTNEARALLLLEANGVIDLDDAAGITATIRDIISQPENIEFVEIEAAQLPNLLPDLDYAIINNNYAISYGLNPVADSLLIEGAFSAYSNILCVKEGNETAPATLALVAALSSKQVADFITEKYDGAVVSVVAEPGDGYDASIDYAALAGTTITVAASPTPHAEILAIAKDILAAKDITLVIQEFDDYVQPNLVVDSGEVYANYFQHQPYLDDFNAQNGTKVVTAAAIHVEPMGLYGGKQTTLDALIPAAEELTASAKGFKSDVAVTITLDAEGKIATIKVDSSNETPNFGTKCAEDEDYLAQFIGKTLPVEGVDALSGATVTSNAVVEALNSLAK